MKEIGKFKAKIYATSDKKQLKKNCKTKVYEYGTISIRDAKLTEYVGKNVILKVFTTDDESQS